MEHLKFDLSLDELIKEVCKKHKVTQKQIFSRNRKAEYVMARAETCYRMRHDFSMTLEKISDAFGYTHASIINLIKRHKKSGLKTEIEKPKKEVSLIDSLQKERARLLVQIELINNLIDSFKNP